MTGTIGEYNWWMGSIGESKIDEYYVDDESICLRDEFDYLVDKFIECNYEDEPFKNMTDEELEAVATAEVQVQLDESNNG